jgi:hypothetical protein
VTKRAARPAYIVAYLELREHPKVQRLATRMGWRKAQAIGALMLLWMHAAEYAQDGVIEEYDAQELATVCDVPKPQADRWVEALIDVGWIDADPRTIHDWSDYSGKTLDLLRENRERVARHRAAKSEAAETTTRSEPTVSTRTVPVRTRTVREQSALRVRREESKSEIAPTALARGAETAIIASDGRHAERQALWSAFDVGMGAARTANERGRRAKAVGDLLDAGVTPDEVTRAIAAWPRVMRDATLTETGIASHVGRLCAAPAYDRAPNGRMSLVELVRVATADFEEQEIARGTGTLPSGHDAHARVVAVARGR